MEQIKKNRSSAADRKPDADREKIADAELIIDPSRVAFFSGILVMAIGALVLVGWQFHIAAFKSVLPNIVSMKANTALCFLLLGWAVAASASGSAQKLKPYIAAAALVVAFIGGATLYEYVRGVDLGLDQALYLDDTASIGTSNPGRMADATALEFIILGLVTIQAGSQRTEDGRRLVLAVVVSFCLAYLALVGYLLSAPLLTGIVAHTKMALHTSAAFMIAAFSILCLPAFREFSSRLFSRNKSAKLPVRFLLMIVMLAPVGSELLLHYLEQKQTIDADTVDALDPIIISGVLGYIFWHYLTIADRADSEARKLAELKDQFLFLAAHELRSPVTGIKWGTEFLQTELNKGVPTEALLDVLKTVQTNTDALADLVNDLLDTSRMEFGTFKVELVDSDIIQCLTDAVGRLKKTVQDSGVELRLIMPPRSLVMMTDCRRVGEVVGNLVSNAVKYNRRGGWVEVTLKDGEERVAIEVKDNGFGLSPEDIQKLFQRFSRIESPETKDIQGTGLGLFIAKQIANLLGGDIQVSSAGRGSGSTFTLYLPKRGPAV